MGARVLSCASSIGLRQQPPVAPLLPRSACFARRVDAFFSLLSCAACARFLLVVFWRRFRTKQKTRKKNRRTVRRKCGRRRAASSPRWPTFPTRILRRGFCRWRSRRFGITPRRSGGGECTRRPSGEHQALRYIFLGRISAGRMRGVGGGDGGGLSA